MYIVQYIPDLSLEKRQLDCPTEVAIIVNEVRNDSCMRSTHHIRKCGVLVSFSLPHFPLLPTRRISQSVGPTCGHSHSSIHIYHSGSCSDSSRNSQPATESRHKQMTWMTEFKKGRHYVQNKENIEC